LLVLPLLTLIITAGYLKWTLWVTSGAAADDRE
jgi:hypothetical protein